MDWETRIDEPPPLPLSLGLRGSSSRDPKNVERVAESFEALFVAQMVRGLREALTEESTEGAGFGREVYQSWFDQAVAEAVARAGGLGLKEQLLRSMEPKVPADPADILSGGLRSRKGPQSASPETAGEGP
jgi:Rod binding domain-containing protein